MGTKKDMSNKFELRMGHLSKKFSTQLRRQKLAFDPAMVKKYEEHLLAILRLAIHDLISQQEKQKAMQRLFRMVTKHVQAHN